MTLNCDLHTENNRKRVSTHQSHEGYITDVVRSALSVYGNRDSVACITTRYELGGPGFKPR